MPATRRRFIVAVALVCGGAASTASCGSIDDLGSDSAGATTSTVTIADVSIAGQGLDTLARLAGERLMTADLVAAAKWGTAQPIDDPAREKTVLDAAHAHAIEQGADPATVQRVFKDQITANKTVQRGLHQQWQAQPAAAPTHRPDLVTEVRPTLDRIGAELPTVINQAQPALSTPECTAILSEREQKVAQSMGLDTLHADGLHQALAHTCAHQ